MRKKITLKNLAITAFLISIGFFAYMIVISKSLSYFSKEPRACINCHVMNAQYATWQHSSHREQASCIECHLPTDSFFDKYKAKAVDGWNHTFAFTFDTYDQAIKISEDGAKRVQKNCILCHQNLSSAMTRNANLYHDFSNGVIENGRACWSCHREVPHGKVRSITTVPHNLGVKEVE